MTASITTTSTYTAGTPAGGTVVLENLAFGLSGQSDYGAGNVAGTTGNNVVLTFPGLPGSPDGTVYVWYLNGAAFTTTMTGSYAILNATPAQSGTYAVYAWAPGNILGMASYNVTIANPPIDVVTSTNALQVNDGSSCGTFTVSLSSAPSANTTVNVSIAGTPNMTVSPPTITMTPTAYQNQTVTVTAGAINSNDSNRSAVVTCATATSSATVNATDVTRRANRGEPDRHQLAADRQQHRRWQRGRQLGPRQRQLVGGRQRGRPAFPAPPTPSTSKASPSAATSP